MNLWVNRIAQLAFLLVALFFFSCEDEASVLGYKNPNTKFEASYIEIPLESSVLLLDSQRTSNFLFTNETNRLLVGQYTDDRFGVVAANTFTQFYTNSTTKLPAGAAYDSVTLQLVLDLYNYGSRESTTDQSISVYELTEDLKYENRRYYFNRSEVQVNPTPLGTRTFKVNPTDLDDYAKNNPDTTILVKLRLDQAFGQRIFDNAILYRDATTLADSIFTNYTEFTKLFKGLSIKTDNGDKIIGISPNSAITLHYQTPTTDSLLLNLGFFAVANFNQIKNDRGVSELAGLTQYSQDYLPQNDLRYIQSGTGVYTKLDVGKFFEFCDTIPNVVITSAELSIESVEQSSTFALPPGLMLRVLNNQNFTEKYTRKNVQDNRDLTLYNPQFPAYTGSLTYDLGSVNDSDSVFYAQGDQSPLLTYSTTDKSYNGNYALFFQQLSMVAEGKRRFQYFIFSPVGPSSPNTKSVNRVIFPKDNIKLKVYYTKPTTPLN